MDETPPVAAVDEAAPAPAALPAVAVPPAAPPSVEILFHADLDGRLAVPACGKPRAAPPPDYAALAGTLARERTRAAEEGHVPVTLLGGNQAAPDVFARSLLEEGPAGARALAALLAGGAYDAVALGHHELSLPPARLDAIVAATRAAGQPLIATNLRCAPARRPLCQALAPELLLRRGGATVGILAVIAPAVLPGIPAAHRDGLSLDEPVATVRSAVRRLRARGATLVVLMAQGPRGRGALADADEFARHLGSGDGSPDLVLHGSLQEDDERRPLLLSRRQGAPPVIGSGPGVSTITAVRPGGAADGGPAVTAVPVTAAASDAATAARLRPQLDAYCGRYGVPVGAGRLPAALTRDEFATYVLEVMRRRAGAEIALVNRAFIKRAAFPIEGIFTRGDLERALPYTAVIGAARVTGAALDKALGAASRDPRLALVGFEAPAASGARVNGRPLDKARSYRVATIAFVAAGGDDLLPPDALPWRPLPGAPDLRGAVDAFLRTGTAAADGDPGIDPRTDFGPPPAQRPLLVGLTDLGVDLLDTSISNGPGYGDAQLLRARQTSLKGEITALLQLRLPAHEVDARLNARYGWTRSQPSGAVAPTSGETADLVTLSALYNRRGLWQGSRLPSLLRPDPYLRAGLESELTAPAVTATQARDYHHLELTATGGAIVSAFAKLKIRGGGGARKELVAPRPAGRWRPVIEAGATLDPVAIATVGSLAARLEGLADYNLVDPTGVREHQLRASGKLAIPLVPLLFLTAGLDVFAVQRQGLGWGGSWDTTVGLRIHLDAAHQSL